MGFFSRIFGKDTIKMVDVEESPEQKEPFITKEDKEKKCVPKKSGENNTSSSPFLDDCDDA